MEPSAYYYVILSIDYWTI